MIFGLIWSFSGGTQCTPVRQMMKTMSRSLQMLNFARLNVKAQKTQGDSCFAGSAKGAEKVGKRCSGDRTKPGLLREYWVIYLKKALSYNIQGLGSHEVKTGLLFNLIVNNLMMMFIDSNRFQQWGRAALPPGTHFSESCGEPNLVCSLPSPGYAFSC